MNEQEELIKTAYARRDSQSLSRLYAWTRPEVALQQYRVFSALSQGLLDYGFDDLTPVEFLDVGCGAGSLLRTLAEWGAEPSRLHGIDLLQDRIERAQALCPAIDYRQHSGWELPYADESMDIVTAMTVFSSILSPEARQALATEMKRVARPGGMIVIFDFRVSSPRNPDTTGIGRGEVQRLFPDFTVKSRSLILAPPLQRPLAKLSPWLALTLETFIPFLRTHTFHFLRNSK